MRDLIAAMYLVAPLALGTIGSVQAQPVTAPPMAAPRVASDYLLGPNDEVEVKIFGQPDMAVKTRIKADGTVNLVLLGPVQALGKTTGDLSREIARAYEAGGYLVKPSVNVDVTSFISSSSATCDGVSFLPLMMTGRAK